MKEGNPRKPSPVPLWKINKIYCRVYDSHIGFGEETIRPQCLVGGREYGSLWKLQKGGEIIPLPRHFGAKYTYIHGCSAKGNGVV